MAYVDQQKKAKIAAQLKRVIPASWKWSLGVRHHSTIVLNIYSAPVDLVDMYTSVRCSEEVRASCIAKMHVDVNPYWWREHFQGRYAQLFADIFAALNLDNHDRSDPTTDYFDVGHYVDVNLGRWNRPFIVTGNQQRAA